jgi:hypothetical protein
MLELHRTLVTPKGVFGTLSLEGVPLCVTCENPWKDNKPIESCIPAGTYQCSAHNGTKYKNVWVLNNVPNRSAILIHAGNSEGDTSGCILVGKYFANFNGTPGVAASKETLDFLRSKLSNDFYMKILWPRGFNP